MELGGVDALMAQGSIKHLKARYCRSVDRKDWGGLREVFCDDATFEGLGRGIPGEWAVAGPDGFVSFVQQMLPPGSISVHHALLPEIILADALHASGTWSFYDYIERPSGTFQGYGEYHERYQCANGRWLIAAMRIERIRVDPMDPVRQRG